MYYATRATRAASRRTNFKDAGARHRAAPWEKALKGMLPKGPLGYDDQS